MISAHNFLSERKFQHLESFCCNVAQFETWKFCSLISAIFLKKHNTVTLHRPFLHSDAYGTFKPTRNDSAFTQWMRFVLSELVSTGTDGENKIIMNIEKRWIWKYMVVACLKLLFWNLMGGGET